jgi:negative regulator of sigma E activity
MTDEQLEFSISQYLDGTLADSERMSLERRLNADAGAMATLQEYRNLNVVLKSNAGLPNISWELFALTISSAVDAADAGHDEQIARRFRMPAWVRSVVVPLAMAASVLVATGIGFHLMQTRLHSTNDGVAIHAQPKRGLESFASISVFGSQAEPTHEMAEAQVAIGPSAEARDEPILVHYSGDLVSRPSHVAVASGMAPMHDTEALQYDMQ